MEHTPKRIQRLQKLLQAASSPVYALDGHSRVLLFNSAIQEFTGWTEQEILGEVCHFQTGAELHTRAALLESLALPAEVWQGNPVQLVRHISHRSEADQSVFVNAIPFRGPRGEVSLVIATLGNTAPHSPLTQLNTLLLHEVLAETRRKQGFLASDPPVLGMGMAHDSLIARIKLAAASDCPVWIHGESGVGKEQIARAIHAKCQFDRGAFVHLDCRTTSAAELGRILQELEISELDLPVGLQLGTAYFSHITKMRADQQFQISQCVHQRQQGHRVIVSSEVSPEQLVARGIVPADIYASLGVITIPVPSLRERTSEIPLLAQFFLEQHPLAAGTTTPTSFSTAVLAQFAEYHWPGNLDELADVISQARLTAQGPRIEVSDLPFSFRTGWDAQQVGPKPRPAIRPLDETLAAIENEEVLRALEQARFNKTYAAELLGIPRARLYRTLEKLGLADHEPTDRGSEPNRTGT